MTTPTLSLAAEIGERHYHVNKYAGIGHCGVCVKAWPCDAIRAAEEIERLEVENQRIAIQRNRAMDERDESRGESLGRLRVLEVKANEARESWIRAEAAEAREKVLREALVHAKEWLDELGCDCGTDEPGTCALCHVRKALAREARTGGGE